MTPDDEEELDKEIWQATNAMHLLLGKRSFNQLKAGYEAVARKYAPLLEARGRGWHALELRRRAAEYTVMAAIETRRPVRTFERAIQAIESLGWTHLERKASVLIAVCFYFARRKWRAQGLRYILPVIRELEAEYALIDDPVWANYLRSARRVAQRLRARRGRI